MGTIRQLAEACKAVDLKSTIEEAVTSTGAALLDYNRSQLYEQSVDADGEPLALYNSFIYALEKEALNPLPGFMKPDLFLTGAFQRSFELIVRDYSYEVDSSDWKSDELKGKYGEKIFGLTPENKTAYAQGELLSEIKRLIEEQTGLKF